jgi:hypothetical protein
MTGPAILNLVHFIEIFAHHILIKSKMFLASNIVLTSMKLSLLKPRALALQKHLLDTLSDLLDKWLRFSLIKIESISETQAKPRLVLFSHLLYILSD